MNTLVSIVPRVTFGRLPVLQSMFGHRHVDTALLRTVKNPLDVNLDRFSPQPKSDKVGSVY